MAYTRAYPDWEDYPDLTTPITAAALDTIEQGVVDAHAGLGALEINVKAFGAKGDGVTNDTAAFAAAVIAAQTEKAALYIPAGDYRINFATVGAIQPWDGMYVHGDGKATILTNTGTGDGLTFDSNGLTIRALNLSHMKITDNKSGVGGAGLVIRTSGGGSGFIHGFRLDSLDVSDCTGPGLKFNGGTIDLIGIVNCVFTDNGTHGIFFEDGDHHMIRLADTACSANDGDGLHIAAACDIHPILIESSEFGQSGGSGIRINTGASSVRIVDTRVEGNEAYQLHINNINGLILDNLEILDLPPGFPTPTQMLCNTVTELVVGKIHAGNLPADSVILQIDNVNSTYEWRGPVFKYAQSTGVVNDHRDPGGVVWQSVRMQPTMPGRFGNVAVGAGMGNASPDYTQVCKFACSEVGMLTGVWVHLDGLGPGSGNQQLRGVVYSDVAEAPTTLLSYSDPVAIIDGSAGRWYFFGVTPVGVRPGNYWLGFQAGGAGAGDSARFYHDIGTLSYSADSFPDGPDATFSQDGTNSQNISVWAQLLTW